jgi:hypothetical protein
MCVSPGERGNIPLHTPNRRPSHKDQHMSKTETRLTYLCSEKSPSSSPGPSSSSKSSPGFTLQIRTCPSRLPVVIKWYDLPHDGAHETEVIENRGEDASPDAVVLDSFPYVTPPSAVIAKGSLEADGEGLSVRRQVGLWRAG